MAFQRISVGFRWLSRMFQFQCFRGVWGIKGLLGRSREFQLYFRGFRGATEDLRASMGISGCYREF